MQSLQQQQQQQQQQQNVNIHYSALSNPLFQQHIVLQTFKSSHLWKKRVVYMWPFHVQMLVSQNKEAAAFFALFYP